MKGDFIPYTVIYMVRGGKRRRCVIHITGGAQPSGYVGRTIAMDI